MSCLHYQQQTLYLENVSLTHVAQQFGTPCYVYSRAALESNWHTFHRAFTSHAHRICYAVKANGNLTLLRLLAQLGSGFDIVSLGELERVLAAGGKANQIVFSGVGKSELEIETALAYGIHCFDVESVSELERIATIATRLGKVAPIALRVNPNVNPETHAHISTGLKENKFGIDIDEIIPLCQTIVSMKAVKLIGLACHIGSQITDLKPFERALDHMRALYLQLHDRGIQLHHINVGGGLGVQYQHETPPDIAAYAQLIQQKFADYPIEIVIEPGRAIVATAGVLLTKVEYIKHADHKNFAIVDAGMNDLLRPALYDAWQNILPVQQREGERKQYDIAGPVCESADFLGKHRTLAIAEGDLLAVDCAGAYGFSMSSNYNARCRPAEVLIDGDKATLIRRRESIQELFALEQ